MVPLKISILLSPLLLLACTSMPTGPSVLVLPGTGRSFEQFRADDAVCRQYALEQVGGIAPRQAASDSMARSAVAGTVIGAAAGAAIGGNEGAGVGAGTGLLVGSMAGASTGEAAGYGSQQRYDNAFIQCMYAKGHRVPVSGQMTSPHSTIPAPPPGIPPPPPPR